MLFRVVLTCWEFQKANPYADTLSGVNMSAFPYRKDAMSAIRKAVEEELHALNLLDTDYPRSREAVYDSDGNIVCYDYPFRADHDGNHTAIVRFWDGDDYREVTTYNIYEISGNSDPNILSYRGCQICVDAETKLCSVKGADVPLPKESTLDKVLDAIDVQLLQKECIQKTQARDTEKSYVVVLNENDDITPLRHIITINQSYEQEEFQKWYYGIFRKLDGDKFIHCATKDAMLQFYCSKKQ